MIFLGLFFIILSQPWVKNSVVFTDFLARMNGSENPLVTLSFGWHLVVVIIEEAQALAPRPLCPSVSCISGPVKPLYLPPIIRYSRDFFFVLELYVSFWLFLLDSAAHTPVGLAYRVCRPS